MDVLDNNASSGMMQPITVNGVGQSLSFRCMKTAFAFPIERVREIIEYGQVTTVPLMPGYVKGVIHRQDLKR